MPADYVPSACVSVRAYGIAQMQPYAAIRSLYAVHAHTQPIRSIRSAYPYAAHAQPKRNPNAARSTQYTNSSFAVNAGIHNAMPQQACLCTHAFARMPLLACLCTHSFAYTNLAYTNLVLGICPFLYILHIA